MGLTVPGTAVLEAIERNVDYAGLLVVQREMLTDIRSRLDARRFDATQPGHGLEIALDQVVDVGFFEESLLIARESKDRPWAEGSEDHKVQRLFQIARDSGSWVDFDVDGTTPGVYLLEQSMRGRLPKARPLLREGLERLRGSQLDRGEFSDDNPSARRDRSRSIRPAESRAGGDHPGLQAFRRHGRFHRCNSPGRSFARKKSSIGSRRRDRLAQPGFRIETC